MLGVVVWDVGVAGRCAVAAGLQVGRWRRRGAWVHRACPRSRRTPRTPDSTPCRAPQGDVDVGRMSPWLLRIEMARDMMVDKKLLLSEVGSWLGG